MAFPLLVVALAIWCATAWASTSFTVTRPNGAQTILDLGTIGETLGEAPEVNTGYDVRYKKGGTPVKQQVKEGWAMRQVLEAAKVSPGFGEIEIVHEDGVIALSENQIDEVPPPALYVVNDDVRFIRNSFSKTDVNGDELLTVSNGTLNVQLFRNSSFKVRVDVDDKAERGELLTITAIWNGGGAGKSYDFEWNFDDGGTATGKTVKHRFEEEGKYTVSVVATTFRGEEGTGRAQVSVGPPKSERQDREGSGTNNSGGAPLTGTYGGSSGAGSSYGDTSTTTPYTPSSPTTDPFDDVPTDQDPAPSTFGDTVEGALLASVSTTTPDAATESAARAARSGDPDFDVPESDDAVPPVAWAGIGALFLMGAGAGLESGRRPRLRRPRLRLSIPRR